MDKAPSRPGRVRAIHHVALKSKQPERLANFYQQALGLNVMTEHTDQEGLRSVWLKLDPIILMIERSDCPDTQPLRSASGTALSRLSADPPGLHMMAYRIDPVERVAWVKRLTSLGCPVHAETKHTVYFADPEGHLFGLSHWPEPHQE